MPEVLVSTAYLAPVQYYAVLYGASHITEERCDHYVKQTLRNRCVIAGANGPLALTLPVVRKGNNQPLRDVEISRHGNWQHLHWTALVSAYKQSPYFDYYADDFRPFYECPPRFLVDFNEALRRTVCDLLELRPEVGCSTEYHATPPDGTADWRDFKRLCTPDLLERLRQRPYYQVFAAKHGFLPGLSIADLLFNMGPESRLVLRDAAKALSIEH